MDFFERQEKAQRKTKLLVFYFIACVVVIVVLVYFASLPAYFYFTLRHHLRFNSNAEVMSWWHPQLFIGVTLVTIAVILGGSYSKIRQLANGGSVVATSLGGELIQPNSTDPDERRLLNIVEEMAIASGVPVPQVYVLWDEKGINAFAAGHTTSDAVIGVTRGAVKLLSRDELQGIIGHEFSHILNGDMRLNIRLVGIIFGILCIATFGRMLLRVRGGDRKGNAAPLFVGVLLLVVGSIGVFFGRLIQAAVCRQREFLADASSVQFTRNPAGLSSALQKIGGYSFRSWLLADDAPDVAHLFFGSARARPFFNALGTHPPLEERIRAIDSTWDGNFPKVSLEKIQEPDPKHPPQPRPVFLDGKLVAIIGAAAAAQPAPQGPPVVSVQATMPNLGTPNAEHLRYAVEMRNAFPPALKNAARDSMGASALVYALLVSNEPAMRAQQLESLAQNTSAAVRQETERLLPDVAPVATNTKLSLVDLALPALRQLSPTQYQQFSQAIQALIEADGEIDLFEYVLQKIVLRHLYPQFNGARKPVIQYYALKPLAHDCSVLLSALAHVASDDPVKCEAAFKHGAQNLSYYAQAPLIYIPSDECELSQADEALTKICQAVPQIKKNVLNACAQVVAADGVIQEMEAELLRAVADTLDCPMPPFLQPKEEAIVT